MMNKIDELMRSIEGKQALLKEAEIKALQQQINPHFMHNLMETIMAVSYTHLYRRSVFVYCKNKDNGRWNRSG